MIKFIQKDKRILCKDGNKIIAFVDYNEKNGYSYAFGKPSQIGGYISFYSNGNPFTLEEAKNRILERI